MIRLAEALAALSLATDAGNGHPLEKSLRNAVIAARFGEALGLRGAEHSDVYYTALLRSIGCTAYAHETAALLAGDDVAFHNLYHRLDPGHPVELVRDVVTGMGAWAPPVQRAKAVAAFLTVGAKNGRIAGRSACEVGGSLARRLGLPAGVRAGLDQVYERWDGKGIPDGVSGAALVLPARVIHIVDLAEVLHREQGVEAARAAVRRRSGGHFDPELAAAFEREAGEILAGVEADHALAAEPAPHARFDDAELPRFARAFADFVDLKSPWTVGHSPAVAELCGVELPALLHDLGRVAVPNGIWDKPGPLTAAERERVRLHPYYTERILSRTPAFADVAETAAADHERLDGSGYPRRLPSSALTREMRLLAAADVFTALRSDRPHRPALTRDDAARVLRAEPGLCPDAVETILGAGGAASRAAYPAGLSEREVEVLILLARGLTNKQIAAELVVSPRTVQHHVAHVYGKIDRRTRAGAAMFAAEHGLTRIGH